VAEICHFIDGDPERLPQRSVALALLRTRSVADDRGRQNKMRMVALLSLFFVMNLANASFMGAKKAATDKDGNCSPELLSEHARLYSEIEALDKIATRCEAQIKSPLPESKKLGLDGLKEVSAKSKVTLKSIKAYTESYRNTQCKAEVPKKGKLETITFNVNERAAELDKLATAYQQMADNYLKNHLANK
jgi:hypothetical protein